MDLLCLIVWDFDIGILVQFIFSPHNGANPNVSRQIDPRMDKNSAGSQERGARISTSFYMSKFFRALAYFRADR